MRSLFTILFCACVLMGQGQKKAVFGKDPKIKNGGKRAKTYKAPKLDENSTDWTKNRLDFMIGTG
ncbi:hypothetical protein OAA53_03690, partial [Salibacteraceae bacterium]|nr:hypothetical protein [Salibacteraceae bacterium]